MGDGSRPLEALLKRDRAVVIAALVAGIVMSSIYLVSGAGMSMSAFEMSSLAMAFGARDEASIGMAMLGAMGQTMATPAVWTFDHALLMFGMWWVMMIAMMLPSAAPMVLIHATALRRGGTPSGGAHTPWPTAAFVLGYLLTWGLFSGIAAAAQWAFETSGLLSPMLMNSTNVLFASAILLLAGAYQLTPLKRACLKHCRGPIAFLARHWRPGAWGALAMGLRHGAYCVGCCWALMAVLFFGGVMNLYWILGLAVLVLVEKVLPVGPRAGSVIGVLLAVWGGALMLSVAI
jgi:predicted metal-binding membrane protein